MLRSRNWSITCDVDKSETVNWWLTGEEDPSSVRCKYDGCPLCTRLKEEASGVLVLKVLRHGCSRETKACCTDVLVATLCEETLSASFEIVLPSLLRGDAFTSPDDPFLRGRVASRLKSGDWCKSVDCSCCLVPDVSMPCRPCSDVPDSSPHPKWMVWRDVSLDLRRYWCGYYSRTALWGITPT